MRSDGERSLKGTRLFPAVALMEERP
uniref:Uncharacterized protein n=1 Tax=Anguilla anguilla TaxID=7936 RepID=A0A0E9USU8_ANGAN